MDLERSLVSSCSKESNAALEKLAQDIVQLDLRNTEEQKAHSFSQQSLRMLNYPQNEYFSEYPVSNSHFSLCPLSYHESWWRGWFCCLDHLPVAHRHWQAALQCPGHTSYWGWTSPYPLASSHWASAAALTISVPLCWTCSRSSMPILYWEPKWMQYLGVILTSAK